MKVYIQTRSHDGALPQIDAWGAVTDLHYGAGDEVLTVCASDGVGMRQKQYFCGQYASVYIATGGGDDYSLFPPDAKRI